MPETSMDEYYSTVPGEHQVRRAWQILTVKSETITQAMGKLANAEFRFGVLMTNPSHELRAIFRRKNVHYYTIPTCRFLRPYLIRPIFESSG